MQQERKKEREEECTREGRKSIYTAAQLRPVHYLAWLCSQRRVTSMFDWRLQLMLYTQVSRPCTALRSSLAISSLADSASGRSFLLPSTSSGMEACRERGEGGGGPREVKPKPGSLQQEPSERDGTGGVQQPAQHCFQLY